MNKELSQQKSAVYDINYLISKLQVYGYKITINNHCIGDYHNIYIHKYKPIKNKIIQFFFGDKLHTTESVYFNQIRLPEDVKHLEAVLNDLLVNATLKPLN